MAESAEFLTRKPEGLGLDLQHPCRKLGTVIHVCNPRDGGVGTGWEEPQMHVSQLTWPIRQSPWLMKDTVSNKRRTEP